MRPAVRSNAKPTQAIDSETPGLTLQAKNGKRGKKDAFKHFRQFRHSKHQSGSDDEKGGGQKPNTADQTLHSTGRVNPSTLAMEMQIPLGSYPGRGLSLPINLSYSSKLWRMKYIRMTPVYGNFRRP